MLHPSSFRLLIHTVWFHLKHIRILSTQFPPHFSLPNSFRSPSAEDRCFLNFHRYHSLKRGVASVLPLDVWLLDRPHRDVLEVEILSEV